MTPTHERALVDFNMPWLAADRTRLQKFREGAPTMMAEVYRVYAPALARSLASSFVFSDGPDPIRFAGYTIPSDLDDVVQETFVKAFQESARLRYDGMRPFSGYLFGIARNLVIDEWRRAARHRQRFSRVDESGLEAGGAREEASPEQQGHKAHLAAVYAAFEESLDHRERALLDMRFEQKLSRREVAERTGWSEMQVRVREKRLRLLLLARLQDAGFQSVAASAAMLLLLGGG